MARKAPIFMYLLNKLDREVECKGARMPEGLAI
jgi:hypothetical protein